MRLRKPRRPPILREMSESWRICGVGWIRSRLRMWTRNAHGFKLSFQPGFKNPRINPGAIDRCCSAIRTAT